MPLRLLVPPRTRPRGMRWVRPAVPDCGVETYCQSTSVPQSEVLAWDADRLPIIGATRFQRGPKRMDPTRAGWSARSRLNRPRRRRNRTDQPPSAYPVGSGVKCQISRSSRESMIPSSR